MGRMYDKQDLKWNQEYWNRQEQQLHADIANGIIPGAFLDQYINETRNHPGEPCSKECGCRSYKVRDGFELRRKRETMKLLRTGMLLQELDKWQRLFKACPHCHTVKRKDGKDMDNPCVAHRDGFKKAKSDVYWAGERNIAERQARGQIRAEGVVTAQEAIEGLPVSQSENPLNEWEAGYLQDVKNGYWPKDAEQYDETPDYRGWLGMLLQNEEITLAQYADELQRLRNVEREREETANQWAGSTVRNGAKKGSERFQRDTRYNSYGVA